MADRFYGVAVGGQNVVDVTVSASTTNLDIELVVDDTNLPAGSTDRKYYIERALHAIMAKIREDEF